MPKAQHPLATSKRAEPQRWTVRIVRASDKAFVDYQIGGAWEAGKLHAYLSGGDCACDCARHWIFCHYRSEKDPDESCPDCGSGAYLIPHAVGEDGTVIKVDL